VGTNPIQIIAGDEDRIMRVKPSLTEFLPLKKEALELPCPFYQMKTGQKLLSVNKEAVLIRLELCWHKDLIL
jgi:hypothetical protein